MEDINGKLFSGIFAIVNEDYWFEWFESTSNYLLKKKNVKYGISIHTFYANGPTEALDTAKKMMEGFSDVNHDGEGDLFQEYCQGLIDIKEVSIPYKSTLEEELKDYYGLTVGEIYDISECGGENIKLKARAINEHLYLKG